MENLRKRRSFSSDPQHKPYTPSTLLCSLVRLRQVPNPTQRFRLSKPCDVGGGSLVRSRISSQDINPPTLTECRLLTHQSEPRDANATASRPEFSRNSLEVLMSGAPSKLVRSSPNPCCVAIPPEPPFPAKGSPASRHRFRSSPLSLRRVR